MRSPSARGPRARHCEHREHRERRAVGSRRAGRGPRPPLCPGPRPRGPRSWSGKPSRPRCDAIPCGGRCTSGAHLRTGTGRPRADGRRPRGRACTSADTPAAFAAHCCGLPSWSGRISISPARPSVVATRSVHMRVCSAPSSRMVSAMILASKVASGVHTAPPSLTGRYQPSAPPRDSMHWRHPPGPSRPVPELRRWPRSARRLALPGSADRVPRPGPGAGDRRSRGSGRPAGRRCTAPASSPGGQLPAPCGRSPQSGTAAHRAARTATAWRVRACTAPWLGSARALASKSSAASPRRLVPAHATPPRGCWAAARKPDATVRRTSAAGRPIRSPAWQSRASVRSAGSMPPATSCPRFHALRCSATFLVPSAAARTSSSSPRRAAWA